MGLSTNLAGAARKLRQNIDEGVDVREAIRVFAEDVEKAARTAKKSARRILESPTKPSDG